MRLSSPELSESTQVSKSPLPTKRRPARRRFFHRRPPPPPSSTTPSEQNLSSSNNESQLDSFSNSPSKSFISSSAAGPAAPPPYINVAPLPIFHGLPGECPAAHLTRFARVCSANNAFTVETMARIFPVTLLDDAALWYELAVEPHSMSWENTKSAFLLAFRRPEFVDSARAELLSLRQRGGESVNAYHLRMQGILRRMADQGLPDSLVRGLFMDGLREEFHDWVVPRRPETVEEAVRLAMDWEGAMAARAARRRVVDGERCGFCEGRHAEEECDARRKMKEEWMRRMRGEGEEEGRLGRVGSVGRRSVCQCWKHQCWKKFERSGSALAGKTAAPAGGGPEGSPVAGGGAGASIAE